MRAMCSVDPHSWVNQDEVGISSEYMYGNYADVLLPILIEEKRKAWNEGFKAGEYNHECVYWEGVDSVITNPYGEES